MVRAMTHHGHETMLRDAQLRVTKPRLAVMAAVAQRPHLRDLTSEHRTRGVQSIYLINVAQRSAIPSFGLFIYCC